MSTGILLGQNNSSIPSGLICIWSGSSSNIPNGWTLCDGNNNTPDLRDRFVLGAGNSYAVGAADGEEEVTLTVAQIPNHNHNITLGYEARGGNASTRVYAPSGRNSSTETTQSVGDGQPHNNMPPYYALCFIMKL